MKNSKLQLDPVVEEMLKQAVENDGKATQEMVQEMVDHPERMPRFMDLKVDWAFKYVLGHKPVLMKLINDVLPVQVSEIEYLPNELPVTGPKEKRSSFDVLCKERGTGKQFLAEMQLLPTMDMDDRLMFYGSSLIHKQIERGSESYHLSPAYVLCIANYFRSHTQDTPLDKFFFGYQLREQVVHGDIFSDRLQFFILELPRLQKVWDSLETNLERWCHLFGNLSNFASTPSNQAGFEDVFNLTITGAMDKTKQNQYYSSMVTEYERYTIGEYARREGLEEGIEQGIKRGSKEKALDVAQRMLSDGMSKESVMKYTGLDSDALDMLK